MRARRAALIYAVLIGSFVGIGRGAFAQGEHPMEAKGFVPEHGAVSFFPWEHIDAYTGDVLLTFTDLVLPGNAGFNLTVTRTYNTKALGWLWAVGPSMGYPPSGNQYPRIHTPDGAEVRTLLKEGNVWQTTSFWRFTYADNWADRKLELPNGIVCHFWEDGQLRTMQDPFGNLVEVFWNGWWRMSSVVQHVGGRTRTVEFHYDDPRSPDWLTSITSEGRTWWYGWGPVDLDCGEGCEMYAVRTVTPPDSPSWGFQYKFDVFEIPGLPGVTSPGDFCKVTLPTGGWVKYTSIDLWWDERVRDERTRKIISRESGPAENQTDLVVNFSYPYATQTEVSSSVPDIYAYSATFYHQPLTEPASDANMMPLLQGRGATGVDTIHADWMAVASAGEPERDYYGNPLYNHYAFAPWRITTTRDGRDYVQELSGFNYYGQPALLTETGDFTRTTAYEYRSFTTLYMLPKLSKETITEEGKTPSFTTSYSYDPDTGFLTSKTVYGVETTYAPDSTGNVASQTDANNHRTNFECTWGAVSRITTPEYPDKPTTFGVNSFGETESSTQRGYTTTFEYDGLGRQTLVHPPAGNDTVTTYAADGKSVTVTRGSSWTTTYLDPFGRTAGTLNSANVKTKTAYDVLGRTIYASFPFDAADPASERGTTFSYDDLGRVTRKENPGGLGTRYAYAGVNVGYSGLRVAITDEIASDRENTTTQMWQASGSPAKSRLYFVTDANGDTTTYSYNAVGSLEQVAQPGGITRTWHYDGKNRLERQTQPELGTVTYEYDDAGNLKSQTDTDGRKISYAYDANDRLKTITVTPDDGYNTTITYDESNNRESVGNSYAATGFTYDAANRLRSRSDTINGRTFVTEYTPDGNGNVTDLKYPSGNHVQYTYDEQNRIASVYDGLTVFASDVTYHPSGGIASYTDGSGVAHTFSYDDRQRPKRISADHGVLDLVYGVFDPAGNPVSDYDGVGNLNRLTDVLHPGRSASFKYDNLDRLETATGGGWGTLVYDYDAVGNRTKQTLNDVETNYGGFSDGANRLTKLNGQTVFGYDNNGNLKGDGRGTYTYTRANMLETATLPGVLYTYRYDGDNQRVMKLVGSGTSLTYYVHGSGEVLSEFEDVGTAASWTVDYVYLGSRLLAARRPDLALPDFNGDGQADIVWRNLSTGEVYFWFMNGTAENGSSGFVAETDPNWRLAGFGDIDGDGKQDLVWRNVASGDNRVTLMDGATKRSDVDLLPQGDVNWQIVGVGDFNGDGHADLLWHHVVTGENLIWFMDGTTKTSQAGFEAEPTLAWQVVGVGDFNGDWRLDLVWRNATTGENRLWLMKEGPALDTVVSFAAEPNLAWRIVAVSDFNADGKPDLLQRNASTGEDRIWFMNGTSKASETSLRTVPQSDWVVGTGPVPPPLPAGTLPDLNRDGQGDIVWRNLTTGENQAWFMNGTSQLSVATIDTVTEVNWRVVGVGDFNRDGQLDLVWRNVPTGENYVWYMNGTTKISAVPLDTVSYPQWRIVGVADFNGDWKPDLLWHNVLTGETDLWYMDGLTHTSSGQLSIESDLRWRVTGVGDVNSDGKPDLVWRNGVTGENRVWYMNGVVKIGEAVIQRDKDVNWQIVGIGDFDGDRQVDILWQHATSGATRVWLMAQATLRSAVTLPAHTGTGWVAGAGLVPPPPGWSFGKLTPANGTHVVSYAVTLSWGYVEGVTYEVCIDQTNNASCDGSWQAVGLNTRLTTEALGLGTYYWHVRGNGTTGADGGTWWSFTVKAPGDFDGDGNADIVWRNQTTGADQFWLMDGTTFGGTPVSFPAVPDLNWRLVGSGDFNHDGQLDLVWHQVTTGETYVWYMNGTTKSGGADVMPIVPYLNWHIVGVADFNADGCPDLVWRNVATGENCLWYLDGVTRTSGVDLPAEADLRWAVVGVGDFDRDGKPDLLWRQAVTGLNRIWYMDDTVKQAEGSIPQEADANWQVVGVADYDGDGKLDLLWRHATSGANRVWLMDNASFRSEVTLTPLADTAWVIGPGRIAPPSGWSFAKTTPASGARVVSQTVGLGWSFVDGVTYEVCIDQTNNNLCDATWQGVGLNTIYAPALAPGTYYWQVRGNGSTNADAGTWWSFTVISPSDFNGDGKADIVWRNLTTGNDQFWLMDGTNFGGTPTPFLSLADLDWRLVGSGDFNGDGQLDLVWRKVTTGETYVWYMNGTTKSGGADVMPIVPDRNWRIVGVADFNADGWPDLVWRHVASGQNYLWYMNGVTRTSGVDLPAEADLRWTVVGAGDVDRDGKPDLLWRHAVTGHNRVWYMNGAVKKGEATIAPEPDANWQIVGVADYDGDRKPDILWRHALTGENRVWRMDNGTRLGVTALTAFVDVAWVVGPGLIAPAPGWAFAKIGPASGTTGLGSSVPLSWDFAEGVTYEVCVDQTNDDSCDGSWLPVGLATTYTVNGLSSGTYHWQVRGNATTGANGGAWWHFTVGGAPPDPIAAATTRTPFSHTLAPPARTTVTPASARDDARAATSAFWRSLAPAESDDAVAPRTREGDLPAAPRPVLAAGDGHEETPSGLMAGSVTGQVLEYYHTDALGSVRAITKLVNGELVIVSRHDYMPFGEEVPQDPPNEPNLADKRLFTGKERDAETGWDYFGARYYRADIGRFTTIDPVYTWQENLEDPQRWNRYAYARNNPLKYVDPDGRAIDTIFDFASIAYDLYKIAREGATRTNVLALGADVGAAVIPFATGAGAAVRAAKGAERVVVNAERGRAFERAALEALDVAKNSTAVKGATRTGEIGRSIPDALKSGITEIKDRQKIYFTRQLQIQYDAATAAGVHWNLVVGPNTQHIAAEVQNRVLRTGGSIQMFDPVRGVFRPWVP